MGSKIDKNNIIKASMEELTEHEPRAYLVAEEHLREQFLQGFKKERGGLFKRVEEFVMPSFKLNNNKVEVIPSDSSELLKQFSLLVDKKIFDAQVTAGETSAGINDEIATLKKGKSVVDETYAAEPNSATALEFYGMPPNLFAGQTPPPPSVHTPPVGLVHATGQTGVMVQVPPSRVPLATIPSSVAPSRTGEMMQYTPPHTTPQQGSGPSRGLIPNTTTAYNGPSTNRTSSSLQASTSGGYQAEFSRFKEDLAGVLKTKLGIDMGSSRLYQKPILLSLICFLSC